MREIRTSGSEGGAGRKPRSYLYLVLSSPLEGRGVCKVYAEADAWNISSKECPFRVS